MRVNVIQSGGLGNLIMATPAIRAIAKETGLSVGVYFKSVTAALMVRDADFVFPLLQPPAKLLFRTGETGGTTPDYIHLYEKYARDKVGHAGPIPHTYADPVDSELGNPAVVMVRGCASKPSMAIQKLPPDEIYGELAEILVGAGIRVVMVGNPEDRKRWVRWPKGVEDLTGDNIRRALGYVRGAMGVITNDTGLYHATAAYQRPMWVLWKDRDLRRARVPDPGNIVRFKMKDEWKEGFEQWTQTLR
jgi:ADP-heptose:LPS heptosyltransferase